MALVLTSLESFQRRLSYEDASQTMDYLTYWSLLEKPFARENVENANFFLGEPQREAIAGLNYFVTHPLSSAVLVGPAGVGMTTLLGHVNAMRGFNDCAAEMILTTGHEESLGLAELALCRALGYRDPAGECLQLIDSAIDATTQQSVQTVWLIDGCSLPTMQLARSLTRKHSHLSVVIGATTRRFMLQAAELGRCGMQIDLLPLSIEDTIEYLQQGLENAGQTSRAFSDNTAVRLHEISGGVLSQLAVLAESSLALAASHGLDMVTPAIVEAVDQWACQAA